MKKLNGRLNLAILSNVRSISSLNWDSALPALQAYRDHLISAQDKRCVYCMRTILRDELGHRELDHILPKSQTSTKYYDPMKAGSNLKEHRRHTRGYESFKFEPLNLAVSCKRCNSFKGTFDALANRSAAPPAFPASSVDYEWVHPHFDDYYDHINIPCTLLYAAVNGSTKGTAVIHACGLDKADQITKRLVESCLNSTRELVQEMVGMTISNDPLDCKEIAKALHTRFAIGTPSQIEACLHDLQAVVAAGSKKLGEAIINIGIELGNDGPIKAPVT